MRTDLGHLPRMGARVSKKPSPTRPLPGSLSGLDQPSWWESGVGRPPLPPCSGFLGHFVLLSGETSHRLDAVPDCRVSQEGKREHAHVAGPHRLMPWLVRCPSVSARHHGICYYCCCCPAGSKARHGLRCDSEPPPPSSSSSRRLITAFLLHESRTT